MSTAMEVSSSSRLSRLPGVTATTGVARGAHTPPVVLPAPFRHGYSMDGLVSVPRGVAVPGVCVSATREGRKETP
ncbi:hypothetical protein E2C01_033967 [Portunus trituberculatus]|uniref:Uncharacterized protein n=1 Tax=Portunus trituberculatus TaxID=210409 RepID=A0A5B7EZA0_PORTR|nr:hypothetical protein [Portunus trituberculatus]